MTTGTLTQGDKDKLIAKYERDIKNHRTAIAVHEKAIIALEKKIAELRER